MITPPSPRSPLAPTSPVVAQKVAGAAAPTTPPAPAPPTAPSTTVDAASQADDLAQPVLDRLSEDEALRGELTDAGFTPLLDWLSRLTTDAARRAAADPDPAATMEQVADAALRLARALVGAAERGDTSGLAVVLAPPLLAPDDAQRALAALTTPTADATPDARAQALVAALSAAAKA